jgi:2-O-methyltransferase
MNKTIEQATPWINLEIISPFLPHNPVIVEAGAHIGKDTLKLKRFWPASTIYAFEPIPHLYEQLVQRTNKIADIFCYNAALSDYVGTAQMYVSSGRTDACSSLLPPTRQLIEGRPDIIFTKTITVPTTTLDYWAKQHHINSIDFVWLDLQGAELKALQAAPRLLATIKALHIEINEVERYKGGVLYDELKHFLEIHGFYAYIKALHTYKWGNALFVRS